MSYCFKNSISVKPGYWRAHNQTDQIQQCLRDQSCIGGNNSFTCSQGYVGGICGQCDYYNEQNNGNYVQYQFQVCLNCLAKSHQVSILCFIIILVIVSCFYFTKNTIEAHCLHIIKRHFKNAQVQKQKVNSPH